MRGLGWGGAALLSMPVSYLCSNGHGLLAARWGVTIFALDQKLRRPLFSSSLPKPQPPTHRELTRTDWRPGPTSCRGGCRVTAIPRAAIWHVGGRHDYCKIPARFARRPAIVPPPLRGHKRRNGLMGQRGIPWAGLARFPQRPFPSGQWPAGITPPDGAPGKALASAAERGRGRERQRASPPPPPSAPNPNPIRSTHANQL